MHRPSGKLGFNVRKWASIALLTIFVLGFIVFVVRTYLDFHYYSWYEGRVKRTICETVHEGAIKGMECE